MLISIYGNNLANSTVSVNGQSLLLNYIGDHQINALLPESLSGIATLTVSNDRGKATTNIYVEAAVPAVFTMGASGTGSAAAISDWRLRLGLPDWSWRRWLCARGDFEWSVDDRNLRWTGARFRRP